MQVFKMTCLATALLASAATASEVPNAVNPVPAALNHTRQVLGETRKIIDSERSHNEKLAALHLLLETFLDTNTMGRRALDKHWDKFSRTQQNEFLRLFRTLFQRTYVQKLLLFDRPDFEFVGEKQEGDHVRVDTLIVTPRDEFAVTYKMKRSGDSWLAWDIQIEDLSLTRNFRRQLGHLLSKSSIENVLGRMRRKYGQGRADDKEEAPDTNRNGDGF